MTTSVSPLEPELTKRIGDLYDMNIRMFLDVSELEPIDRPIAILQHTKRQLELIAELTSNASNPKQDNGVRNE